MASCWSSMNTVADEVSDDVSPRAPLAEAELAVPADISPLKARGTMGAAARRGPAASGTWAWLASPPSPPEVPIGVVPELLTVSGVADVEVDAAMARKGGEEVGQCQSVPAGRRIRLITP